MKTTPNPHTQVKKTKIVATLGPGCHNTDILADMIRAGMNCARFNFSHGSHEEHFERLTLLRKAHEIAQQPTAILLDTKGPEIRTGELEGEDVALEKGAIIAVSGLVRKTSPEVISVSYTRIHKEVRPDDIIKIADGSIILRVDSTDGNKLMCTITKGGILGSRKNVNIPGVKINLPGLLKKDVDDIHFAIKNNFDYIAASFIRSSEDVLAIKNILTEHDSSIRIIAKIENQEGLDNLESIVQVADGIMVARGDLAEQIPSEEVPLKQKSIIKMCNENQKIAITATQMLQSMEESSTPTRAELTDVANAIFDGTDALMLSGESAKGKYPVESIATMTRVALAVESSEQFRDHVRTVFKARSADIFAHSSAVESIIAATQIVADKSNAQAIACPSMTGNTPKYISCLRPPNQHIVATCHHEYVYRQLLLLWGVVPVHTKRCTTDKELIETAINACSNLGFLQKNEKVVIVAGLPINKPLMINTIQVYFNGKVLLRSRQGVGPVQRGKLVTISGPGQLQQHAKTHPQENFIYHVSQLTYNMLPALQNIAGILVTQPAEVPLETVAQQHPQLSCLAHMDELVFHNIKDGDEIIISGNEKFAYEP